MKRMKRLLLVAAMMMTAVANVNAQDEYTNEVGVTYGFGAISDILSTFTGALSPGDQTGFWGPVGVEYYHFVSPSIGVGGVATLTGCKWGTKNDYKTMYISVMPSLKWSWLRKEHFGLYSKAAAGIMIVSNLPEKDKSKSATYFTGQVSALGMEVGTSVRCFLEAGFGEQGMLVAGLRYKF